MKNLIVVIVTSMLFVSGIASSNESIPEKLDLEQIAEQADEVRGELLIKHDSLPITYAAACCKICKKGKACGDSCISKSYTCRKPAGCACDG